MSDPRALPGIDDRSVPLRWWRSLIAADLDDAVPVATDRDAAAPIAAELGNVERVAADMPVGENARSQIPVGERRDARSPRRARADMRPAARRVAIAQLVLNGLVLALMLLSLVVTAVAIIVMPFALGRQGVGLSMISMFGLCVTAILAVFPYLATRGATRALRGDVRGFVSLRRIAWLGFVLAATAAFVAAYSLGFIGNGNLMQQPTSPAAATGFGLAIVVLIVELATLIVLHTGAVDALTASD